MNAPLPIAVLLAGIMLLTEAGSAEAKDRCAIKGTKTVTKNSQVRVFSQGRLGQMAWGTCKRSTGKVRYLAGKTDPEALSGFKLAGPFVAYISECGNFADMCDTTDAQVVCASWKTGKERFRLNPVLPQKPAYDFPSIEALVLTSAGHVAYTAGGWDHNDAKNVKVGADDPSAAPRGGVAVAGRTLDMGTGIDPKSLTLSGTTATWTNAGATKTADLGG